MTDRPTANPNTSTLGQRALGLCAVLVVVALVFLAGVVVTQYDLPPSGTVRDALTASLTLSQQRAMIGEEYSRWNWSPATRGETGVVVHRPELVQPGYTLYSSGHTGAAILLDMRGDEVHRWDAPFSKVWPDPEHVSGRLPDRAIHIRQAVAFPNGDLVAQYACPLDTPAGYGVARLDRDANAIWTYDARTHHDIDVGPDGTVYTLTEELRDESIAGWDELPQNFKEEFVTVVAADGGHVKTFSLHGLLRDSPFFRPMMINPSWDALHSNTVNLIGPGFAARHEGVSAGDLMVCLRNLNLVAAVNPDTERIVWAITGPWHHPHDPDPLDNGNVLIFDNVFSHGPASHSRVLEFDPISREVVWEYSGAGRPHPLRSDIRGQQQLLANGNVLITETNGGRLLEVTREGEVAWEFLNPVRARNGTLIPVVCTALRYSPEELPFLKDVHP